MVFPPSFLSVTVYKKEAVLFSEMILQKMQNFFPVPVKQPARSQDPANNQQRFPEEKHDQDQGQDAPAVQTDSSDFRLVRHSSAFP